MTFFHLTPERRRELERVVRQRKSGHAILAFLAANRWSSIGEIASGMRLDRETVAVRLATLVKAGQVVMVTGASAITLGRQPQNKLYAPTAAATMS